MQVQVDPPTLRETQALVLEKGALNLRRMVDPGGGDPAGAIYDPPPRNAEIFGEG